MAAYGVETQAALAAELGVSENLVQGWGKGRSRPTLTHLQRAADATGRTVDWFLRGVPAVDAVPIKTYTAGGGDHWVVADEAEAWETKLPPAEKFIAFRISGDSMDPVARDGQTIFALAGVPVQSGDLAYVEMQDGTATFKRVIFDKSRVILQPVNPAYQAGVKLRSEVRRMLPIWGVRF